MNGSKSHSRPSFQSGQRNESLRLRSPEPSIFQQNDSSLTHRERTANGKKTMTNDDRNKKANKRITEFPSHLSNGNGSSCDEGSRRNSKSERIGGMQSKASKNDYREKASVPDNLSTRSVASSDKSNGVVRASRRSVDTKRNGEIHRGNNIRNRHEVQSWRRQSNDRRDHLISLSQSSAVRAGSSLSNNSDSPASSQTSSGSQHLKRSIRKTITSEKIASRTVSQSNSTAVSSPDAPPRKRPKMMSQVKRASPVRKEVKESSKQSVNGSTSLQKTLSSSGDWTVQTSAAGKPYYYNRITKKSQWAVPAELLTGSNQCGPQQSSKVQRSDVECAYPMKRKLEEASFVEKQNEDVLFSGKADSKTLATVGEKASTSLLGSPISDEEVAPARVTGSPIQSEEMDISIADESMSSISPSKNSAAGSTCSSPSSCKPCIPQNFVKTSDYVSLDAKKTKAPTVEDLKKLNETQDPEGRKYDRLQRVEKWMSETTVEIPVSPADDVSLSPVSSDGSAMSCRTSSPRLPDSPKLIPTPSHFDHDESLSGLPSIICPSPLPPSGLERITLPEFEFPELTDTVKAEYSQGVDISLVNTFRSLKVETAEDKRSRQLFANRLSVYCRSDEKTVRLKKSTADVMKGKIIMTSQSENIVFLTGFEDELSKAMHLRSESKEEGSRSKLIIKAEVSDVYVKTDSSPSNRDTRPSGTLFLQTSDVKDVKILA